MSATADVPLDLAAARAGLARGDAPALWRSLDELADTAEFRQIVAAEFPRFAGAFDAAPDRRTLLKLMGAALAMAGLAACDAPEAIVPYVHQPENLVPGRPLHFATALMLDGYGIGAIVESHEGRPTKIAGNPAHPASLGATDAIMQAACLSLYDPARSRTPLHNGQPAAWDAFLGVAANLRARLSATGGQGLAVLIGTVTSPSLAGSLDRLRTAFPNMRLYRHDPLAAEGQAAALQAVAGRPLVQVPHFDRARVVVSLDADFLGEGPGKLAHARAFAGRRILRDGARDMLRLYAAESTPTITGASADYRWAVRASAVPAVAAALAARLGLATAASAAVPDPALDAIAADLRDAGSAALVLAGAHQDTVVHRLALAMNATLGSLGTTATFIAPPHYLPAGLGTLADLTTSMNGGELTALLMLAPDDPVRTAPADVLFGPALAKVPVSIHSGLHADGAARAATWHIPAAHDLEAWGDARAFDGTASLMQPMIRPLFGGRTPQQILAVMLGDDPSDARALVRAYWQGQGLDDQAFAAALQRGLVPEAVAASVPIDATTVLALPLPQVSQAATGVEVRFAPDPWLRAGINAANTWLNELPRPLSKIVWGNAALIAPATAGGLGVTTGDVVAITHGDARVEIPVSVEPGHAADAVTLPLGFGFIGPDGKPVGVDVLPLRTTQGPWVLTGVSVSATGGRARIVTTQNHQAMEGRDIARRATLAEYAANPFVLHGDQPDTSLYPQWDYPDEAWGMVIDQTACIGCMACVSACQAENNIPTVGADECARGHEMHWLRVDRYYAGTPDEPQTLFQPVPCMQCEEAPCEEVCPVNATVHTHDGLNAQVYNRCIGTRYCSQNCPYKVRRFNFFEYQPFGEGKAAPLAPLMNPDVSVRSRGVMEKCTYCVQRIEHARIDAGVARRPIADGEVVPACAEACPARAIVFGNLNDKTSAVRRLRDHPLDYTLLPELNTRPRTTFLGRITNPNPALADPGAESGHG